MSTATSPYFPQDFTHHALSNPFTPRPPLALIIVTDSGIGTESTTYEFSSVSEALGNFERVQYERRYANRDAWRSEPFGVHFHSIVVLDTAEPDSPAEIVRSMRMCAPDGEWTDKVAHLWVTNGEPKWITTRGDYTDKSQPVINYQFS